MIGRRADQGDMVAAFDILLEIQQYGHMSMPTAHEYEMFVHLRSLKHVCKCDFNPIVCEND